MTDMLYDKQQNLRDIKPDNQELERFITDYTKREPLGTTYIPTLEFIKQEITDIYAKLHNSFLMTIEVYVTPAKSAFPFMHSTCATRAFEALTRGHTLTIGQVIEAAKVECENSNRKIIAQFGQPVVKVRTDGDFETICWTWIKTGIAFVYYIQFLYQKMKDHQLTLEKFVLIINTGDGNFFNTGNHASNNINVTIGKNKRSDEDALRSDDNKMKLA